MRLRSILLNFLYYLYKKVIRVCLVTCVVVGLSFLITGKFSILAYSERVFWGGIVFILLGGTIVMAQLFGSGGFDVVKMNKDQTKAKDFMDQFLDFRLKLEDRFDVAIQLWLIGFSCIAVSALVQTFLT
jgi:hypothetical protein